MPGYRLRKYITLFIMLLLPFWGNTQDVIVGLSGNFVFNTNTQDPNPPIVGFSGFISFITIDQFDEHLEGLSDIFSFNTLDSEPESLVGLSDFFSFNTTDQFDERLEGLSDLFSFNNLDSEPESLVGLSNFFSFNTIDQFDERLEGLSDLFAFNTLEPEPESLIGLSDFFSFNTIDQFDERMEGLSGLFSFNTIEPEPESLVGLSDFFSFNTIDQFDERLEGLSDLFAFNTVDPEPESLVGVSLIFTFNTTQHTPGPLIAIYGLFNFNTLGDPLPVEWLFFDAIAMDRSIELQWKTASEINNDYFTVLRSADGYNFEPIALVNGSGTTSTVSEYQWTDTRPLPGLNYYQLRQTDFDGTTDYSHIVAAIISLLDPANIYVFEDLLHIQLPFSKEKHFELILFDPLGRILKSMSFLHSPGTTHKIDLGDLPHGLLLVNIRNDNIIYSEKVLNIRR